MRDARAVVLDREKHRVTLRSCRQPHLHRTRRVYYRILQQVGEHALEQRWICPELRYARHDLHIQCSAGLTQPQVPLREQILHYLLHARVFQLQLHFGILEPREFQQVADQIEQIVRPGFCIHHRACLRVCQRTEISVAQHLQRCEYGRQRRLEVMDDHLHQVVLQLLQLPKLANAPFQRVHRKLEPKQRPNAGTEDEPVVRLGKEVVATRLYGAHTVTGLVKRGDEDYGYSLRAWITLDPATHFKSCGPILNAKVTGRHRDVEDAHVRHVLQAGLQGRRTVVSRYGSKAQRVQLNLQKLHIGGYVVCHQNERCIRVRDDGVRHELARSGTQQQPDARDPAGLARTRNSRTTGPHDCQVHKGAATCERTADSPGTLALLQCVAADAEWKVAPVDSGTAHHWRAERRRPIHLHTQCVLPPILRIQRRRHGAHALTEAIEIAPLRVPYPGSECGAGNAVLDRRTPTGWNAGVCNHRVAHPGIQITAHLCGRTDREATNGRVQ